MSEAPQPVDPEYIAARTVLLDALTALATHRAALVVVGAQAVYLRTGAAGLSIAPYTADGDLALDPTLLGEDPLLEEAMQRGGFQLLQRDHGVEPGTWVGAAEVAGHHYQAPVDLIVPAAVLSGGNTRAPGCLCTASGQPSAPMASKQLWSTPTRWPCPGLRHSGGMSCFAVPVRSLIAL